MSWDKTKPSSGEKIRTSRPEIGENWDCLEDALLRDHVFPGTKSTTAGRHNKVTLVDGTDPAAVASHTLIYSKSGEVYYRNAGGIHTLSIPAGTKAWFYQNVAPTGWTLDAACADALLAVKGGSNAFNVLGGLQAGTWTASNHTHTVVDHAHTMAHTHTMGNHTHAGPSHTHDIPAHSHSGGAHTHMGGNHTHSMGGSSQNTGCSIGGYSEADYNHVHVINSSGGVETGSSGSLTFGPDGAGTTTAAGTGNTGTPSTNTSDASSAANTGSAGAQTSSASASPSTDRPLAQVGIICTKD